MALKVRTGQVGAHTPAHVSLRTVNGCMDPTEGTDFLSAVKFHQNDPKDSAYKHEKREFNKYSNIILFALSPSYTSVSLGERFQLNKSHNHLNVKKKLTKKIFIN